MSIIAVTQNAVVGKSTVRGCNYDGTLLTLGIEKFDQDFKNGWRALRDRAGCEEAAADVLRQYREKYASAIPLLYWHEGQVRASIGQYRQAAALMERSHLPGDKDLYGWNAYVDATIAFLKNDRHGFIKARKDLRLTKKPKGWPDDAEWPQNSSAIEALWNCFGKPYKVAYTISCKPKTNR